MWLLKDFARKSLQHLRCCGRFKKQREEFTRMLEGAEAERGGKALLRFAEARDLFEDDQRWKVRAMRPTVDHIIHCAIVRSPHEGQQPFRETRGVRQRVRHG